jgi:hypothetical protein
LGKDEQQYPLVLLDFEGIGDAVERRSLNVDTHLLLMALVLSSFLILNVRGVIEEENLTMLECVFRTFAHAESDFH